MFETLIQIVSIVFKPLFDTSKEAILRFSSPRRKMARSLIKLYDELETIQHCSEKLLTDADTYISKEWVAWTVARSKRQNLIHASRELQKATINLGMSLIQVYSMFRIQGPEIFGPLVYLFSFKESTLRNPFAAPEVINLSNDPKVGDLRLVLPRSNLSKRELTELIHEFRRFDSTNTVNNYLLQIDIDKDKQQLAELIKQARPILEQIEYTKVQLRDFIQRNVSIEDFFN
jgi:hypothetical protein